jgi:hypothetical protein
MATPTAEPLGLTWSHLGEKHQQLYLQIEQDK